MRNDVDVQKVAACQAISYRNGRRRERRLRLSSFSAKGSPRSFLHIRLIVLMSKHRCPLSAPRVNDRRFYGKATGREAADTDSTVVGEMQKRLLQLHACPSCQPVRSVSGINVSASDQRLHHNFAYDLRLSLAAWCLSLSLLVIWTASPYDRSRSSCYDYCVQCW